jgi:hypothetical protein
MDLWLIFNPILRAIIGMTICLHSPNGVSNTIHVSTISWNEINPHPLEQVEHPDRITLKRVSFDISDTAVLAVLE